MANQNLANKLDLAKRMAVKCMTEESRSAYDITLRNEQLERENEELRKLLLIHTSQADWSTIHESLREEE